MNLDLSSILLVIVAIAPGQFAQRSRDKLIPRSFAPQGVSGELAELVALGVATHGILIILASLILLASGWLCHRSPDYFFAVIDRLIAGRLWSQHIVETALVFSCYIFLSFVVSYFLGLAYGILGMKNSFTTLLFTKATWLTRWFGVKRLLEDKPIIYEVLPPPIDDSAQRCVFVEIEMKHNCGFYSGQVRQFAIVKDEEPHKPVYLIDVWFKPDRDSTYKELQTDGIMIDLADALTMSVQQVEVVAQSNSS